MLTDEDDLSVQVKRGSPHALTPLLVLVVLSVLTCLYDDAVYVCFSSLGVCDGARIQLVFDIAFSRCGSRQE